MHEKQVWWRYNTLFCPLFLYLIKTIETWLIKNLLSHYLAHSPRQTGDNSPHHVTGASIPSRYQSVYRVTTVPCHNCTVSQLYPKSDHF